MILDNFSVVVLGFLYASAVLVVLAVAEDVVAVVEDVVAAVVVDDAAVIVNSNVIQKCTICLCMLNTGTFLLYCV